MDATARGLRLRVRLLHTLYARHCEISAAAAQAKKLAKGLEGCRLFAQR